MKRQNTDIRPHFPGPYFDFLVIDRDSYLERHDKTQRVIGLRKECFHNPDAVVISDSIVSLYIDCFATAKPEMFNYFGYTVYEGIELDLLAICLRQWLDAFVEHNKESPGNLITSETFLYELRSDSLSGVPWFHIKNAIAEGVEDILVCISEARSSDKVLLVLGV